MARRVKTDARIAISESDLLDALATASAAPEDAKTAQQLSAETGIALSRVQAAIRALYAQGRVQCYRVPHIYVDGRRGTVPAYTFRPSSQ